MTLIEWKKDFKEYIDMLMLHRDDYRGIMEYIDEVPANGVTCGEWKDIGSGQVCSECGEFQPGYDNFRFYCPYCGARMGGRREGSN